MNEALKYIDAKIYDTNKVINRIIEENLDDRDYLSKNVLSNLRYLVEYCFFRVYIIEKEKKYVKFNHDNNKASIKYMKSCANMRELRALYGFLQISTSHTLPNGDGSSRVLIKYLNYLIELKNFMKCKYNMDILENLYSFPLNIEKNMENYYLQIFDHVKNIPFNRNKWVMANQYYVKKVKPIIINKNVFYEVTLSDATDYINKFNRIVVYSKIRIMDNYAIKISSEDRTINLFGKKINIKIINNYKVAIRPCEFNNYAKIFGLEYKISSRYGEYDLLMKYLMSNNLNLLDIVEFNQKQYDTFSEKMINKANTHYILNLFDASRNIILKNKAGSNILKYILLTFNNVVIKSQLMPSKNCKLSNLYLNWGSIPFDEMPYASSLTNHKVDISDLLQCIDSNGREHELLSRRLSYNSDSLGEIYTKINDISMDFEYLDNLIDIFNSKLYLPKHEERKIIKNNKYVYINGYEQKTMSILQELSAFTKDGYDEYSDLFSNWEMLTDYKFSDPKKYKICKELFIGTKIALIYGSAGCGKTETIKIISSIFEHKKIVFLAKTNPAVENLKRRIGLDNQNFKFLTIDKYKKNQQQCDLLIIDECSTVDNYDMNALLSNSENYDLLLLVGDIYQIESIKFGNWFRFAKNLLPDNCIKELDESFRTKDPILLDLWQKVRNIDDDIIEYLADNDMSYSLNEDIFEKNDKDEIILCLNYDGPYGINSINRYLQSDNDNAGYEWGINTYKVDDPILFNDLNRFYPVLYNNLKGTITEITKTEEKITFKIRVDIFISDIDAKYVGLEVIERSDKSTIICFSVNANYDDDVEDKNDSVVPFVIAYATSIHKSQGLEYKSVKIVINDEIGDIINHNIFYTAITRAKENLKIYWTPECMNKVVKNFVIRNNDDINIIKNKITSQNII